MGPDMSKRCEQFHGYDNPQPPPESNRSFLIPAQCPECGGDGILKIPRTSILRENREKAGLDFFAANVAPCLYCDTYGRVELTWKTAWYFQKYLISPLKNRFQDHRD